MKSGLARARALGLALVLSVVSGAVAAEEARGRVTGLPLPRFVSIKAETVNARRGPSRQQRIDWAFVRRGLPVEVVAEYEHWRRIRDSEGAGGWVHYSLLSGRRTVIVAGVSDAALRAAPEPGAELVARAEPGAILNLKTCQNAWCAVSAGAVSGWLARDAVWGVGPKEFP